MRTLIITLLLTTLVKAQNRPTILYVNEIPYQMIGIFLEDNSREYFINTEIEATPNEVPYMGLGSIYADYPVSYTSTITTNILPSTLIYSWVLVSRQCSGNPYRIEGTNTCWRQFQGGIPFSIPRAVAENTRDAWRYNYPHTPTRNILEGSVHDVVGSTLVAQLWVRRVGYSYIWKSNTATITIIEN